MDDCATDAPATNVSSTMRRFSSIDLFCLFFTWLATSMVICSDVSTYPSWTLSDGIPLLWNRNAREKNEGVLREL
jgi:hypothetical protein